MEGLLLKLDAFRKIQPELTSPTLHGAYLTMLAYTVMAILFLLELRSFITIQVTKSVELDSHFSDNIWIDFDVVMHALPCQYTNVVIRDIVGHQELEVLDKRITKERVDVRSGTLKGVVLDDPNAQESELKFIHQHEEHPELESDWDSTSDHFQHNDFEKVVEYHDFTMINFYAEWCIHCRNFAPTWAEAEKQADKIVFYDKHKSEVVVKLLRVNCVDFGDICNRVGIRAYPTVRMYKQDKTFSTYQDARNIESILNYVKDFVHNSETNKHATVSHHSAIEEGCRIHGEVQVRRVPGYFLLEADSHLDSLEPSMTNVSHLVNHLWFLDDRQALKDYLANTGRHVTGDVMQNIHPMKLREFSVQKPHTAPQHYLNVIPTVFDDKVVVYQSTVQSHIQDVPSQDVPQARFSYTFSPMTIKITTGRRPFYDFVTSVFAIIGGTYTFISLVDKFWDTVSERYKSKIGKLG